MKRIRIPKKIEKISTNWVQNAPFFSEFTLRFYYHECEPGEMPMPTCGVSVERGRLNFYYDKEFLKKLPIKYLEFVMIHEIMHIISLTIDRAMPEKKVWNVATDMIINDSITTLRIGGKNISCWDQGTYLSHAIKEGYKGSKISEELYEWLIEKYDEYKKKYGMEMQQVSMKGLDGDGKGKGGKDKQDGQDDGGGGSGTEDSPLKNMFKQMDVHDWLEKQLTELDKKAIQEVVKSARMRSWGTMSGAMVEYLDDLTRDKALNWKQLLRKYTNKWTWGKGPVRFRTWSKRNRRQLPLPGYKRPHNELVVAVDTSGSIDQASFQAFFNEVETIAKDKDRLTILECDTEIKRVYSNYRRGDYKKIKLEGRGGTNFQPPFDWMVEHKKQNCLLIYFTDLWASWDFDKHHISCIWCTPSSGEDAPVEYGKTVHIDLKEDKHGQ